MKRATILLTIILIAGMATGGSISGTITNATTVDGYVLVVAALHAGITDLTSAPMTYAWGPEFPYDYTITNDAIVSMNFYFPIAYMPAGILPASGDPFGARLFPPVIPIGGTAEGVDLTLFSSGNIGGDIDYDGNYGKVCVNVYDYYSFFNPTLESTHYIGDDEYFLEIIPSGPKQVQAFDDLNGNMVWDEGEPSGYYEMPFIGLDIVLVTGNVSSSGIDITISPAAVEEESELPEDFTINAYPNPFNSAVTIFVSGEATSPLQIEIFDINGRLIDVIARPKAAAIPSNQGDCFVGQSPSQTGSSTRNDGTNFIWQPDASLGSGVYLVRARFGPSTSSGQRSSQRPDSNESISKRIIYLK